VEKLKKKVEKLKKKLKRRKEEKSLLGSSWLQIFGRHSGKKSGLFWV